MPRYSWRIDDLIFEEDAKAMFDKASTSYERVLVALCWITGARTQEMLSLRKEDIYYDSRKATFTLRTLKLGGDGSQFVVRERTLEFDRPEGVDANIYLETILRHIEGLAPETRLLPYTSRWAEIAINRLGLKAVGKKLTPYHFRHSVLTWLARNGKTLNELMHFKGARSIDSVKPYLHAIPSVINLQNLRREREQKSEPPRVLPISEGEAKEG